MKTNITMTQTYVQASPIFSFSYKLESVSYETKPLLTTDQITFELMMANEIEKLANGKSISEQ